VAEKDCPAHKGHRARTVPAPLHLVKPALLGLSITQSFRKLQSDVLEIQWSVEIWVATQFSEASVASARAPSDASGHWRTALRQIVPVGE